MRQKEEVKAKKYDKSLARLVCWEDPWMIVFPMAAEKTLDFLTKANQVDLESPKKRVIYRPI